MDVVDGSPRGLLSATDWRLRLSFGLTAVWLALGFLYISKVVGWTSFVSQTAPSLGSFLEGAFAPLAFLWLVVGFFLQQHQLHENTKTIQLQLEQMRRTAEQAEVQTRAIAADELHSRQDTFLRTADLVNEQLGLISAWIVTSYEGTADGIEDLWRRAASGDSNAFSLEIIRRCFSEEVDPSDFLYGTEVRSGHTLRFMRAFERLVEAAGSCDSNGMIADAVREGLHGRVYRIMEENAPPGAG